MLPPATRDRRGPAGFGGNDGSSAPAGGGGNNSRAPANVSREYRGRITLIRHADDIIVGFGCDQRKSYARARFGQLWSEKWQAPRPRVMEKVTLNEQGEFVLEP